MCARPREPAGCPLYEEDLGIVMKRMSSGDTLPMQLKLFGQLKEECEDQLAIFSIVNSVQVKYEFQSLNPTPVDLSEYLHGVDPLCCARSWSLL